MSAVELARQAIAETRDHWHRNLMRGCIDTVEHQWVEMTLDAAESVLDRHAPVTPCNHVGCPPICSHEWGDGDGWEMNYPCDDAAAVLDIYVPGVRRDH